VLGPVVQRPVLPVLDAAQALPLGRSITLELVRHDHAGDICEPLQPLAEKLLGGLLIPAALDQNIEHVAVLIHRPPEILVFPMDREEDFVEMPRVADLGRRGRS
jgi:hypothetical protein